MTFYNCTSDTADVEISSGWDAVADFSILARGYVFAAECVLEKWQGRYCRRTDLEAYPILFLYRHALELSLKHVLYRAFELSRYRAPGEIEEKFLNDHNLPRVWGLVSKTLELLSPYDQSAKESISKVCVELSELDPGSYTFRYPTDKNGEPVPKTRRGVNLSEFVEEMNKVLEFLDTLGFALSAEVGVAEDDFTERVRAYGLEAAQ